MPYEITFSSFFLLPETISRQVCYRLMRLRETESRRGSRRTCRHRDFKPILGSFFFLVVEQELNNIKCYDFYFLPWTPPVRRRKRGDEYIVTVIVLFGIKKKSAYFTFLFFAMGYYLHRRVHMLLCACVHESMSSWEDHSETQVGHFGETSEYVWMNVCLCTVSVDFLSYFFFFFVDCKMWFWSWRFVSWWVWFITYSVPAVCLSLQNSTFVIFQSSICLILLKDYK